jgi:hypothetical protein
MAEVIQKYDTQLSGPDGRRYRVQACGRGREDGMWEGWLEFLPVDGGEPVTSQRESTQPNRADLLYWATGLTDPYLDGALLRTLRTAPAPPRSPSAVPFSSGPAPRSEPAAPAAAAAPPRAVLDPFQVYAEGADVLRGQLHALNAAQLRNIIQAYGLSSMSAAELERPREAELIAIIMTGVERTAG